uniref:Uncharacterized protein n=1 Tax=Knipowitschia caucasica TaxID=637954 RepID=A0AAV2LZ20_KNICA
METWPRSTLETQGFPAEPHTQESMTSPAAAARAKAFLMQTVAEAQAALCGVYSHSGHGERGEEGGEGERLSSSTFWEGKGIRAH